MEPQDLTSYLFEHGHFSEHDENNLITVQASFDDISDLTPEQPRFIEAVKSWQKMRHWLQVDGLFGPKCFAQAAVESQHRCGLPDLMHSSATRSKWPDACKHDLLVNQETNALPFDPPAGASLEGAWQKAITLWNESGNLFLSLTAERNDARIRAQAQPLSRYILAWSELAYGDCMAKLDQAYNTRVRWHYHLLWTTICHEIGHALGIGHGGRGIMQPAHDSSVNALGTWDVNQLQNRYGKNLAEPPQPPAPPHDWHRLSIHLYDAKDNLVKTFTATRDN